MRPGLARSRHARRGALGAAREPKTMHLADHGIAGDAAKLCGDLTRGQSVAPHLLQALDALIGPGHAAAPFRRWRDEYRFRQNPTPGQAAPFADPTPTPVTDVLRTCPPHEISYLTIEKLQYGESRAQESQVERPHVPFRIANASTFFCADARDGLPAVVAAQKFAAHRSRAVPGRAFELRFGHCPC